jgi:hypothetical protein
MLKNKNIISTKAPRPIARQNRIVGLAGQQGGKVTMSFPGIAGSFQHRQLRDQTLCVLVTWWQETRFFHKLLDRKRGRPVGQPLSAAKIKKKVFAT